MTVQYTPFDLIQKIMQNNYSYTHSYTKKITEADENVEKLQDKVGKFKKSVQKLKRYSAGSISKDLLESQAEDLVKTYNDMKNSSAKVTDPALRRQMANIHSIARPFRKLPTRESTSFLSDTIPSSDRLTGLCTKLRTLPKLRSMSSPIIK